MSEPIFQAQVDKKIISFFALETQVMSRVEDVGIEPIFSHHDPTIFANEAEMLAEKPEFGHLAGLDKAIAKAYNLKRYRVTLPDDVTVEVWCFNFSNPYPLKMEVQKKLKKRIHSYKRIEQIDPPDDAP